MQSAYWGWVHENAAIVSAHVGAYAGVPEPPLREPASVITTYDFATNAYSLQLNRASTFNALFVF